MSQNNQIAVLHLESGRKHELSSQWFIICNPSSPWCETHINSATVSSILLLSKAELKVRRLSRSPSCLLGLSWCLQVKGHTHAALDSTSGGNVLLLFSLSVLCLSLHIHLEGFSRYCLYRERIVTISLVDNMFSSCINQLSGLVVECPPWDW